MLAEFSGDGCALDQMLQGHGDRPFLIDDCQGTLTFAQTYAMVGELAASLRAADLPPGSMIGVYGLSARATILCFLAAMINRHLLVPLNSREKIHIALSAVRPALQLDAILLPRHMSAPPCDVPLRLQASAPLGDSTLDAWGLWRFSHQARELPASPVKPGWFVRFDQPLSILFTSGTSGRRKGVLHTFGNHFFSAAGTAQFYDLSPEDRWLITLPLFHVGGLLVPTRCLIAGAACLLPDAEKSLAASLTKLRPSFVSLVPTQLFRIMNDPDFTPTTCSLKALLLGGAGTPDDLLHKATEAGLPLSLTYGSTEACSQVTATKVGKAGGDPRHVGQLLPWRKLRVSNGLAHLAGQTIFLGYIENSRLSRPHDQQGWWQTADRLAEDAAGWRYLGRADDIMIVGGENVSPAEIENLLSEATPDGAFCRIVPYPDAAYGSVPVLVTVASERPDPEKIIRHLKTIVSGLKIPRRVYWCRKLPEDIHKLSTTLCLEWIHQVESGSDYSALECVYEATPFPSKEPSQVASCAADEVIK